MKYLKNIAFALLLSSVMFSCQEEGPYIQLSEGFITGFASKVEAIAPAPQQQNVLIEDITGVRCSNCVAGHDKLNELINLNPGRVIGLALHPYTLPIYTSPYPGSADFRDKDSAAHFIVTQLLDNPNSMPAGGVNRKLYPGKTARNYFYSDWATYTAQELATTTPANLNVKTNYKPATRELKASISITYASEVTDDNYLSVLLSEDSIIDKQLSPSGIIPNYEHKHVLRKMLTPLTGKKLNSSKTPLEKGRNFEVEFTYEIPSEWKAEYCHVVAIVHKNTTLIDVVQCAEAKVK